MKRRVILSLLTVILFGCSQSETLEHDAKLLMKTVVETQGEGVFYDLVEAERRQEDLASLVEQAEAELELSRQALENIEVESEEVRLIQGEYLNAIDKNTEAFLMIKQEKITDQTEAEYKKLIQEASKIQQEAVESCLDYLKINKEEL